MSCPYLAFSDKNGKIYSHPFLRMAASSSGENFLPEKNQLISMPRGSSVFFLPHRFPVGFNPSARSFETLKEFNGHAVYALAAVLPPAYLRLSHPAYVVKKFKALPLWAYTACGFYKGSFYVTARRVDSRIHQSPHLYKAALVKKAIENYLKHYPANRLYRHLSHCALNYNCLNAKNLFLERWEAGIPASSVCNARCIGCISYQSTACEASHQRINFIPTREEIVEAARNFLLKAHNGIVSFGQGCEGEPLLLAKTISSAIAEVRSKVACGTIHMNTNASLPAGITLLCKAGVDSFRVSLNSANEKLYKRYFSPRGYSFSDVISSIAIAKKYNKFVSLNLLVFPGISDSSAEIKALFAFIRNTGIDMIQWRNLHIDPEYYIRRLRFKNFFPQGMSFLLEAVAQEFPHIKMGYFNLPKEKFKSFQNLIK
ncbi:MAG: radical SAM protein [Candidatus Omnitrophica bacterium]|nr:radical SAM protein [Candidatus Omnitrophota bacterium]